MVNTVLMFGVWFIIVSGGSLVVFVPKVLKHIDAQIDWVKTNKHIAQQREKKQDFFAAHITCIHWAKISKEERDQIGVSDSDMKRCNIITKKMVEMVAKAAAYGDKFIDHNFQNDVEQED